MTAPKPRDKDFWEDSDDERHGTTNGYTNLKCRCDRCTQAWKLWHREYMHRGDNLQRHAGRQRHRRNKDRADYVHTTDYTPRPRLNENGEWVMPDDG
jgi:hypothetical protein